MATGTPDPVEVWAPMFLYFGGNRNATKFTKEQVLEPKFALVPFTAPGTFGTWCRLCDAPITDDAKSHMRKHKHDLTAWLVRRKREAAKASQSGLKTYRQEQEMFAKAQADEIVKGVIHHDDDDD